MRRPRGGWPEGAGNGQEVLCTSALGEALGWEEGPSGDCVQEGLEDFDDSPEVRLEEVLSN